MSRSRKTLFNVLRLVLAAAMVWWVVNQVGWDNLVDTLTRIDLSDWVLGFVTMFGAYCISMVRWRMLMHSVGIEASRWVAFRLGFIGAFFNNVVPGLTGGDLVKALYVARDYPDQRADAVLTVVVDRIVGIVALALIAAVVIPFDFDSYHEAALGIYGFLAVALLGACAVLSRRVKAKLRSMLAALRRKPKSSESGPSLLSKLDAAVSTYRARLGVLWKALFLSIGVHLLIIISISFFGAGIAKGNIASTPPGSVEPAVMASYEFLRELGLSAHCSIVPIIMIISAIPIAPAGWGIGEMAFQRFYGNIGMSVELAVSLSFTYRLSAMLLSLLGAVFLLLDRERVMTAAHSSADGEDGSDTPDPPA